MKLRPMSLNVDEYSIVERTDHGTPYSFIDDLACWLRLIILPGRSIHEIEYRHRWHIPFFLGLIATTFLGWAQIPIIKESMRQIFEQSYGVESSRTISAAVSAGLILDKVVLEPAGMILRWFVLTGGISFLIWVYTDRSSDGIARIVTLVVSCEIIFIVISVIDLIIKYLFSQNSFLGLIDYYLLRGFGDLTFGKNSEESLIVSFLNKYTIGILWYAGILVVGVQRLGRVRWKESILIVSIVLVLWGLVSLGVGILYGRIFHFGL